MFRIAARGIGALALALIVAAPASAQIVQSVQFGVGVFSPRGFDSRAAGDVLVENLITTDPLLYEIKDFRGPTAFGEWIVGFGDHVEVAGGVGFYSRTTPSVYRDLVNVDGREIEQRLKLRIVPVTGLVRFLPFGRMGDVQPYVGAGVSALNWRYIEAGEFVDADYNIFQALPPYTASGTTVAPVWLVGVRVPIRGDIYALGLEYRHQSGEGDLGFDSGFLSDKIDLGGGNFNFSFLIRF
ncbi:MAG: outer membrane beta-barrel protein [Vicinamibacterales bacterium]